MINYPTTADAKITLESGSSTNTVDLYSDAGRDLICSLYLKLGVKYRWHYETSWLGIQIIQFPHDVIMVQELIWKIKPDYIVECGVAHGGSCILYASLLELIGHGKVVGVDVEIRAHNRKNIEAHPLAKRIQLIEGSSVAMETVEKVREVVRGAGKVLVLLDSNHTHAHVRQELELYADMVTPGSYLVAMDGAQAYVGDVPGGKPEWTHNHPLTAIDDFLQQHKEYEIDHSFTRLIVTSNPNGYLKKSLTA